MLDRIHTKVYEGTDIPSDVKHLTRFNGLMKSWLEAHSHNMKAVVAYDNNRIVAWCCYRKVQTVWGSEPYMLLGTFVANSHRSMGIGALILDELLQNISKEYPGIECRYGAPEDSWHFNDTYMRLLRKHGLRADHSY